MGLPSETQALAKKQLIRGERSYWIIKWWVSMPEGVG